MSQVVKFEKSQLLREPSGHEVRLHLVSGPEEGTVYKITGKSVKFGRHSDNDIILQDLKASRFHAEMTLIGHRYVLRDLKSQNGVFVNNQKILESEVRSGDFLSIGNTVFKFVEHLPLPIHNDVMIHFDASKRKEDKVQFKTIAVVGGFLILTIIFIKVYFSGSHMREPSSIVEPQVVYEPSIFETPTRFERDAQTSDKNEEQAEILYHQGYREYFAGNYERAIDYFQSSLALMKNHRLANIYLKNSYKKLEDEVKYRFEVGNTFLAALQFKEAEREFERIIEVLNFYPESKVYQTYYFKSKEYLKNIESRLALEKKGYY
ncbi:MAG: FHA domain-containing protein [Deltaproteobacteria bacterium]|nr:FHA domain-containing protein [Deltaproteobacteria bacterium]